MKKILCFFGFHSKDRFIEMFGWLTLWKCDCGEEFWTKKK
jgi:hypothetical protein